MICINPKCVRSTEQHKCADYDKELWRFLTKKKSKLSIKHACVTHTVDSFLQCEITEHA